MNRQTDSPWLVQPLALRAMWTHKDAQTIMSQSDGQWLYQEINENDE